VSPPVHLTRSAQIGSLRVCSKKAKPTYRGRDNQGRLGFYVSVDARKEEDAM
jgi:hypothetical protein